MAVQSFPGVRLSPRWKKIGRVIEPYLYLAPAFTIFICFMFIPLGFSLFLSFTKWDMISLNARFVGLDNYIRLFQDESFWLAASNTAYFTLGIVPTQMALALGIALLLNNRIRLRGLFRGIYFLPVVVPIT